MLAWDTVDLALALWTPLVVAWTVVAASTLLAPDHAWRAGPGVRPSVPAPRPVAGPTTATLTLHAMLDAADARAASVLELLAEARADPVERERSRRALELTTLVALLMTRDWAARMDRERLDPHVAPVVDAVRSRTADALLSLFVSPPRWEARRQTELHALELRRLREHLASLGADLRTFDQALHRDGRDPYR